MSNKLIFFTSLLSLPLFLSSCDDGGSSSQANNPDVFSIFLLNVEENTNGIGQPAGASLFLIERSDGLSIRGQIHSFDVIEESEQRVAFEYSGGPLTNGVSGIFDADLESNTWTLTETPGSDVRNMSGTLELTEFSDHSHD